MRCSLLSILLIVGPITRISYALKRYQMRWFKKAGILFLLLFGFYGNASASVDVTCFSGEFIRGTGAPIIETINDIPGIAGPAILKIINGAEDDTYEKVSSSVIKVNGDDVLMQESFNQNVSYVEKEIVLKEGQNSISVELAGKPGGKIKLTIVQNVEAEAAAVIGGNGGEIIINEESSALKGVKVVIPSEALQEEKVITVSEADVPPFFSDGTTGAGPVLNLGPNGTEFNKPVQLQLPYTESLIAEFGIIDENTLNVFTYDETYKIWIPIKTLSIDTTNNTITAEVNHFSIFAIQGDQLHENNVNTAIGDATPVLFVHGIQLGLAGEEDAYGNAYDTFGMALSLLESAGVKTYWLEYNSYNAIEGSAVSLALAIGRIKVLTGSVRVNVIAHSLGGLVTRAYLEDMADAPWITDPALKERLKYRNDVGKVLMFGTPNGGVDVTIVTDLECLVSSLLSGNLWGVAAAICAGLSIIEPESFDQMNPDSPFITELNNRIIPNNVAIDNVYGVNTVTPGPDGWNIGGDGVVSSDRAVLPERIIEGIKKYSEYLLGNHYHSFIPLEILPWDPALAYVVDADHLGYRLMEAFALDLDNDGVTDMNGRDLCPGTDIHDPVDPSGCSIGQSVINSSPLLLYPENGAINVDPNILNLQWKPLSLSNGEKLQYCVVVNEDSEPEDISVWNMCDQDQFVESPSIQLVNSLLPGRTYWWAVWVKTPNGSAWSKASDWWSLSTLPDNDGDDFAVGADCDDNNSLINPNAIDICGNGIDEDCSGPRVDIKRQHDTSNKFVLRTAELSRTVDQADVRTEIMSGAGCWYTVTPRYDQPGFGVGNPNVLLIPPYGRIVVDEDLALAPGQYYYAELSRQSTTAQVVTALDVILRGLFSQKLEDVISTTDGKIDLLIELIDASGLVSDFDTGTVELLRGDYLKATIDYVAALKKVADAVGHDVMEQTFVNVLGISGKWIWNTGISTLIEGLSLPDKVLLLKEIVDNYVLDPGPFEGYVKVEALSIGAEADCVSTDADNDGMPDWWEIEHHFDPTNPNDAIDDPDGDGYTNLQELAANTDPTDGDSYPPIGVPVNVQANYQPTNSWNYITWDEVPGAVQYNVYWGTEPVVEKTSESLDPTDTEDYGHTGVVSGWTYYYRVAAVDASGNESELSEQDSAYVPFTNDISTWNRVFGGTSAEEVRSIIQSQDGGYVLAGYTHSYGAGDSDVWLIKTDKNGNELWSRTFGGIEYDSATSIIQSQDGGYVLAGYTYSYGAGDSDVWLIKTDENGNELWSRTFGGTSYEGVRSIIQSQDGGYVLAGYTFSYGAGDSDIWIVKTDKNGNELWSRTFGGISFEVAYSIIQSQDGGYVLAGYTYSYGAGDSDVWLIKTDENGNELWSRTFGGIEYDSATSIIQSQDGGYAVVGHTDTYGRDAWLIKTDENGNELWNQTFGGTNYDNADSVIQSQDGGYVLAGVTGSYGAGGFDAWLIKTDESGNELWSRTFGGTSVEEVRSIIQSQDGGYVLAGYTHSYGAGGYDAWLIKTDENGNAPAIPTTTPSPTPAPIPDDVDNDGDGYTENQGDCNDSNNGINPGATEVCGDGIDQDCDGSDLACGGEKPDLIISNVTMGPNYYGYPLEYTYTITNIGNAPADLNGPTDIDADNVSIQAFLSNHNANTHTSGDLAAGGTIIGLEPLPILNPGESISRHWYYSISFDTNEYPYLKIIVDWGEQIEESNEENNVSVYWVEDLMNNNVDDDGDGYAENDGDCNDGDSSISPGATEICGDGIDQDCSGSDLACGEECPSGYVSQQDYGDCSNRPAGTVCMSFSDSFKWIVYESITGWSSNSEAQIAIGTYGEYHHILNTNCIGLVGTDTDEDLVPDGADNCPNAMNADQVDSNGDGIGDACQLILTPSVTAFNITPTFLFLGESITVNYIVSAEQGLDRVELWRAPNDSGLPGSWEQIDTQSVSGNVASGNFVDTPFAGIWHYGIHVVDTANQCTTEENMDCETGISNGGNDYGPILVTVADASGLPDLIISDVQPGPFGNNTLLEYTYTIMNISNGVADMAGSPDSTLDNAVVQTYISRDNLYDQTDIPAGGRIVSEGTPLLYPGQSWSISWNVADGFDPLEYPYLIIILDRDDAVHESNENNNISVILIEPLLDVSGRPDLIISDVQPGPYQYDYPLEYTYWIKNIGDSPISLTGHPDSIGDNVAIQTYLSKDNLYDQNDIPADVHIVSEGTPPLQPGQSLSQQWYYSFDFDPLEYPYLIIILDIGETVYESNENNNISSILIEPLLDASGLPDLIISDVQPGPFGRNALLEYTYTIMNIGDGAADMAGSPDSTLDNAVVQTYISRDNYYDQTDIPAGGRIISEGTPLLYPGQSLSIPWNIADGFDPLEYPYLIIILDRDDAVHESNESNNISAILIENLLADN